MHQMDSHQNTPNISNQTASSQNISQQSSVHEASAPAPQQGWRAWLASISLGFAAFIFVTTELLPVGLLPELSADLDQSLANTGLLVTIYAWCVALMSLPLTVWSARWERRSLLLWLLGVFIVSHILSAFAQNYIMLMSARICIALTHAIFWSIATPLTVRVAPPGKKAQALGIIVTGTSLATVLGVPLGTLFGHSLGWRFAFIAVAVAGIAVFLTIRRLLPPMPSQNVGSFKSVPQLMRRPELMKIYAMTVLTVTGHFAAFTYFNPFLREFGGFSPELVILLLLLIGGSGVLGSYISSKYSEAHPWALLVLPLLLVCGSLALTYSASSSLYGTIALCVVWGAAMTAVCLVFQTRVLTLASDSADVAVAIYSGIFNIGIGGGSLLGGKVLIHAGLGNTGYAGAVFVGCAALLSFFVCNKMLSKPQKA